MKAMNADEFVEVVRKGADKLRVDEIMLNMGDQEFHGKGILVITRGKLKLYMTLDDGETPPAVRTGGYTKSDFGKVTGLIQNHLQFTCESVSGVLPNMVFQGGRKSTTLRFDLHPLILVPVGMDAMNTAGIRAFLGEAKENKSSDPKPKDSGQTELSGREQESEPGFARFEALLADFPLLFCNSGTKVVKQNDFLGEQSSDRLDTLKGEFNGFDFGLVKEAGTKDIRVVLKSKAGYESKSEKEDWRFFDAFMTALAFTHGVHAWPYRTEYWRDGRKLLDRVTAARSLGRTAHAPFSEGLAYSAPKEFLDAFGKAASFFASETELSEEIRHILFLFRCAGERGVHAEITMRALCALFENLVRLLFRAFELDENLSLQDKSVQLFKEAKTDCLNCIQEKIASNPEKQAGYSRLARVLSSAGPYDIQDIFKAVASHLGLQWENEMQPVFRTWKTNRNSLLHAKTGANPSEDELKQSFTDESRIAGAINILLLKLFRFSGRMRTSAFEDVYRAV